MLKDLLDGVILGILLFIIFVIIERIRFANSKMILTDKFLVFLEEMHRRTAPKEVGGMDIREYALSDKVRVKELYFYDTEISGPDQEGESKEL